MNQLTPLPSSKDDDRPAANAEPELYLVKSWRPERDVAALARRAGARVVLRGAGWAIAACRVQEAMALQRLPGLFVGGVSLDTQRLVRLWEGSTPSLS